MNFLAAKEREKYVRNLCLAWPPAARRAGSARPPKGGGSIPKRPITATPSGVPMGGWLWLGTWSQGAMGGRKLRHGWRWGPASPSSAPQLHPLHPSHRLCLLGSCSPEALQGTTVTAVRIRPRAAGNGLAGVRRRRRRKGRLRTAKAQTTALGALRSTGQPPPVPRAGAEWLPTCCQPGLILHPAMSPAPHCRPPPPVPPSWAVTGPRDAQPRAGRCGGAAHLPPASIPHRAGLGHAPKTALAYITPWERAGKRVLFFLTLGKRRDFRGSL